MGKCDGKAQGTRYKDQGTHLRSSTAKALAAAVELR
jgi:hypothetical protein